MMSIPLFIMFILLPAFITHWKRQPQILLCVSWLDTKHGDTTESIFPVCVCVCRLLTDFSLYFTLAIRPVRICVSAAFAHLAAAVVPVCLCKWE